jgi:hypothetical protein
MITIASAESTVPDARMADLVAEEQRARAAEGRRQGTAGPRPQRRQRRQDRSSGRQDGAMPALEGRSDGEVS